MDQQEALKLMDRTVDMLRDAGLPPNVVYGRLKNAILGVLMDGLEHALGRKPAPAPVQTDKDAFQSISSTNAESSIPAKNDDPDHPDNYVWPPDYFKGTGKKVRQSDGTWKEIGTWMYPKAEAMAAYLSKKTGIFHLVNQGGEVVSVDTVAGNMAASEASAGTPALTTLGPGGPIPEGNLPR